jgi:hypothetical protein
MNLIQRVTEQKISNAQFMAEIVGLVQDYQHASKGQQSMMFLVGKIQQHKRRYSQRSPEFQFYQDILDELDVSKDQASSLTRAYNFYNKLLEKGVDEYTALAESATPYQLLALKEADNTETVYDAARYLKKNGRLPSVKAIKLRGNKRIAASFEVRDVTTLVSDRPSSVTGAPLNTNPSLSQQTNTPQTPDVVAPKPQLTEEELQLQRYGITDESQRHHILSLIANENLAHITTVRDAYLWHLLGGGSLQALVPIIKQKLSQSKEFEVLLRELVLHHTAIEVTATQVPTTFDNAMHDGIRWRR